MKAIPVLDPVLVKEIHGASRRRRIYAYGVAIAILLLATVRAVRRAAAREA